MFLQKKKRYRPAIIIILCSLGVLFLVGLGYRWHLTQKDTSDAKTETEVIKEGNISETANLLRLAPTFLGFHEPKNYLVLFFNNTELRPTGGFIGSYAIVTMDKGKPTITKVDGSENTNWKDTSRPFQIAPKPLMTYLGVPHWYFRDANWSPDFKVSAKKAIELYNIEVDQPLKDLDFVVGVTPKVLEVLLDLVGDVTVQGITFTAQNVIEKLEYEVEFGFQKRNIPVDERKNIIRPLFTTILKKMTPLVVVDFQGVIQSFSQLANTKHVQFFAFDKEIQSKVEELGWSGEVKQQSGDFLMWIDANLGALKTDHAMFRSLDYRVVENDGKLYAEATMQYQHNGVYDWRTTRYRSYSRVFVPRQAHLIEVMIDDVAVDMATVDRGESLGKTWFGAFISIEPGMDKTLTFRYELPPQVVQDYINQRYSLYVQKQAGTGDIGLTLNHNFGKQIVSATPPESQELWGDATYHIETDLEVDRTFDVSLK